ncbi:MAG: AgmX/PglI C-terminal domain-containing protein [Sandaracinaceae bacterium]
MRKLVVLMAAGWMFVGCGGGEPAPEQETDVSAGGEDSAGQEAPADNSATDDASPEGDAASAVAQPTTDPDSAGSLPREAIQNVVRDDQNGVRYCYERELAENPELAGRVVYRWIIGADGHVQSVLVESTTLENEAVERCVHQRIQRWEFPAPIGGIVIVTYPFTFGASG